MRKIYILVVLSILLFFVSFGLVYQYAGLKDHFRYIRYLNGLAEADEQKKEEKMFFGNANSNIYGGTLAWVASRGLFVWGRTGLKYFVFNSKTSLLIVTNCFKDSGREFETNYYKNFEDWRKSVKYGNQVFVDYGSTSESGKFRLFNDAKGVMVNPNFDTSTFYFCRTNIFD